MVHWAPDLQLAINNSLRVCYSAFERAIGGDSVCGEKSLTSA